VVGGGLQSVNGIRRCLQRPWAKGGPRDLERLELGDGGTHALHGSIGSLVGFCASEGSEGYEVMRG
jgi:hypothetical protein